MSKKAKFILTTISIFLLLMVLQIQMPKDVFASEGVSFDKFNFPDAKFREAIQMAYPSYTKDGVLYLDEISKIISLDVSESGITDLTGIENFISLEYLNISVNNLKKLDLSKNVMLNTIEASNNQLLESIELPKDIENIYINFNYSLKDFDISKYEKIKNFYGADVKLNNVDLTNLSELIALDLSNTNLSQIDVSKNLKLEYLNVSENNLIELDLRTNINLITVDVVNNKLNKIELPNSIRNGAEIEFYTQQVQDGYEVVWYENDKLISGNINLSIKGQTLTSKIQAKSYSVIFNANGGRGSMQSQAIKFDERANLIQNTFTRNGYTFEGWALSVNSEIKYLDKAEFELNKYPSNGKVTLYAVWKPIKYTVEFDANGGNGSMNRIENILYGTSLRLSANSFTKDGYTFVGWTNSKSSSIIRYFDKQTVSNLASTEGQKIILYAVWEKNEYNIKFNVDGKITSTKVSYKNKVTAPKAPTKTGYTFIGWYDEKTNEKYDFNKEVTSGVSLVAKWKINSYNVVLNGNGNTRNNMNRITLRYNQIATLPANTYVKDGYEFIGWSLSPNGEVVYSNRSNIKNLSSKDNDTVTLYAQWKFIKKDFKVKVENKNVTYNGKSQTISISNIPAGSKVEYRTSKDGKWTTVKPTRTSVGTTTVYYRITNPNYNTIEGSGTIKINAKQMKNLSISNISNKTYTGKQIKPSVTVKDGSITLKSGTNYTVSYGTNKYTGKAYIKITGKGNYIGTITKYFNIVPKTPTLSISAGKGTLTITAKAIGASGYEISYATAKNGKYKVVTSSSQRKTINKLTRGRNYYVKVRAYKIIDGKKVYSGYSSVKMIRVR